MNLASALLMLASAAAGPAATYRLSLDATLAVATVEFCVGDWPKPPPLVTRDREAERFRSPARVTRGALEIVESRRGIGLRDADPGDCLTYDVDLERLGREGGERALRREGDSVLTASDLWLWRPAEGLGERDVRLEIELPDGMQASVPWPPAEAGADGYGYRLTPTPRHWQDLTAFGSLSATEIEAAGARIRLAVTDAAPRADAAAIAAWIGEAARAVGTLYGRFPLPSPQVVVVPIGRRAEPVPWAQVQRGGGTAAHFFVDQHRPLDEFREDWTATHELSHMLLPYVSRDDAWLSEGVASYYQNVLRARAGMIRPEEAWEKLYAGFGRGRGEADEATLAEASGRMHERGVFMRVYWSGAAIALIADVALRRESGGERSMDAALEGLADCCLPSYRTWTARELLTRLDALSGSDVLMTLHDRYIDSPAFPDLGEASAALGIVESPRGLSFTDDTAAAALRRAIMSAPAELLAERDRPDGRASPTTEAHGRPGDGRGPRGPAP